MVRLHFNNATKIQDRAKYRITDRYNLIIWESINGLIKYQILGSGHSIQVPTANILLVHGVPNP